MSSKSIVAPSYSKINPAQSQRSKPQRSPRRPRPHGHPRPDRYRPPSRPTRYALDVGRNISLALTLERHRLTPNKTTLAKIGGKDE